MIHCPELREGERIPFSAVERVRPLADRAEFLLFHTGWGRYWGTERYFGDYPCIDSDIVDYLLQSGKKGVGIGHHRGGSYCGRPSEHPPALIPGP